MMALTEAVEWAGALDVAVADVPAVLRVQSRRVADTRQEAAAIHRTLADAPDADLSRAMSRAVAALGEAESRLHDAAVDARRTG